jgi:hypothetical protein
MIDTTTITGIKEVSDTDPIGLPIVEPFLQYSDSLKDNQSAVVVDSATATSLD